MHPSQDAVSDFLLGLTFSRLNPKEIEANQPKARLPALLFGFWT